ncbi:uncharacterized protein LOC107042272 [Diachasma alloeum]|uniref:uncharacterized protein LOC107042272 n=1 Tax=Diachasma alloeum TaxID=454923 RepID=UPI000738157A|nr:uncharacterized protein LOC107042272 [Diachasma alloeum]
MELWASKVQNDIENSRRTQQHDLGRKMEDLKVSFPTQVTTGDEPSSPSDIPGVAFPIATLEDFEKFEKMLDPKDEANPANPDAALQNQGALKNIMKLKTQGSNDYEKNIKIIMPTLIKKEVQGHYSGFGRTKKGVGKKNFSATMTFKCLEAFLEQKFAGGTVKFITGSIVSAWLGGWSDCEGGGAKRKRGED